MPDWLSHVITGLASAAGIAALFKGWALITKTKHQVTMEVKRSEIDVLHEEVEEGRKERRILEKKIEEIRALKEAEINLLKSELTAALIEKGSLKIQKEYLEERNKILENANMVLEQKVDRLEKEVARLRQGVEHGQNPSG